MIVCVGCKCQMECVRTGIDVVFGKDHAYRGDMFRCGQCGQQVVDTALAPYFIPERPDDDDSIYMA